MVHLKRRETRCEGLIRTYGFAPACTKAATGGCLESLFSKAYHKTKGDPFCHWAAPMLTRKYLFPRVIEMNYQAGRRLGVNVYLIDGGSEFLLIDIGYLDTVEEIIDLIRRMDFNLSTCKMVVATHADADHIQGAARARELLRTKVAAHPLPVEPLETGDQIMTYASIKAQGIEIPMPPCKVDVLLNEGDVIKVGDVKVKVWHTPGHT